MRNLLVALAILIPAHSYGQESTPEPTPEATPEPTPDATPDATPIATPAPTVTPEERPSFSSGARPGDVGDPRDGYDEVVFFNPLLLIGRTVGVGYERVLDPRYSVLGGLRLTHYGEPFDAGENDRYRLDGLSAYVQPHLYPWARAPRGFYIAPYTSISYYDVRDTQGDDDFTFNKTEVGATLGWSWLIRRFNIKFGLGAGYYWADAQHRDDVNYTGNSFTFAGDLDFGIAF